MVSFEAHHHQLQLSLLFRANPTPRFIVLVALKSVQKSAYRKLSCHVFNFAVRKFS
jgi:hypothetical protein